jgi:hypothetical protein
VKMPRVTGMPRVVVRSIGYRLVDEPSVTLLLTRFISRSWASYLCFSNQIGSLRFFPAWFPRCGPYLVLGDVKVMVIYKCQGLSKYDTRSTN